MLEKDVPKLKINLRPSFGDAWKGRRMGYLFLMVFIGSFIVLFIVGGRYLHLENSLHAAADIRIEQEIEKVRSGVQKSMFEDIKNDHSNAYAIFYLAQRSIIKGYEGDLFKPDDSVNRAEFIKLIAGILHIYPHNLSYGHCFSDVGDQWFAPYVCFGVKHGWISSENEEFGPDAEITVAEVVDISAKALNISENFSIELANGRGWFENMDFGEYIDPDRKMTRAQVAELLFRIAILEVPVV